MGAVGIKNERKIIDGFIVAIAVSSAYFGGFIQTLGLGAVSFAMLLPVGFILLLCFMHLVLRKSRKFDESEHSPLYVLLKGLIFTGLIISSYRTGVSTMNNLLPSNIFSAGLMTLFAISSLYLMAYRANLNS